MIDFDSHIRRIDSVDESDARSALTEVLAAVASVNADVECAGYFRDGWPR